MARWVFPQIDEGAAAALASALNIALPAARVLCARGLSDPAAARRFLAPSLDQLHDPLLMAGMPEAVARLRRAVDLREPVLVYGDYDVDGTTSIVILTRAIELAGGVATWHVPHRLKDGYGMRPEVVEKAAAEGVRLIVSVDTGIRAAEVVRRANELSIDVVVTDHHLPDAELPPALAVLNPNRRDCAYPEKNLCGVGVAFKLAQALLATLDWPERRKLRIAESFLKLVAIGTVADVVPLTGENRIIVRHGLAGLADVRNAGLRALLDVAGFTGSKTPDARQVAFQIAPRLNAAGRMDTARAVVELFLAADAARAREIAQQLHDHNAERQQVEAEIREACERVAVRPEDRALVFAGEGWHRGVLGIVASRMVERYCRPVFVLGIDAEEGIAQGSGRSIASFHLLGALESMADLFQRFGGHEHAAGVTLAAGRVEEFRGRFAAYGARLLTEDDLVPRLRIDAEADLREISEEAVEHILALAPFGCGNPAPVLATRGVEVAGCAPLGEKHLRLVVRCNGRTLSLKAWNAAVRQNEFTPGARLDVAFAVEEDAWSAARGYPGWCAVLKDARPAEATAAAS